MKKIFLLALAAFALVACDMDLYRSDALTAEELAKNPDAPLLTTNGIYTLFQDKIAYKGQSGGESGNYYIRHIFQLNELRGDNVTVSGITEDPFINPYRYTDDNTAKNIYYTWWIAYKIIDTANSDLIILANSEENELNNHLKGENYFFRALCHFQMVNLFAMPYANGRDNLGVPLRLEDSDKKTTTRATVGEVYDQVVADLIKAKEYMALDKEGAAKMVRGNDKGYASWFAASALLARVYLYMGDKESLENCLAECNELLKIGSTSLSGYDYADYPTHTYVTTSKEIRPNDTWTNKFIFPPYEFSIPDAFVSNFHLPCSTMLMMEAAFGGFEKVMNAYDVALEQDYRFGPYGDALLII